MVKLANTLDLGSSGAILAGSSPVTCTKPEKSEPNFPNRKRVRIFYLRYTNFENFVYILCLSKFCILYMNCENNML